MIFAMDEPTAVVEPRRPYVRPAYGPRGPWHIVRRADDGTGRSVRCLFTRLVGPLERRERSPLEDGEDLCDRCLQVSEPGDPGAIILGQ
jgi:hypothetical protein